MKNLRHYIEVYLTGQEQDFMKYLMTMYGIRYNNAKTFGNSSEIDAAIDILNIMENYIRTLWKHDNIKGMAAADMLEIIKGKKNGIR